MEIFDTCILLTGNLLSLCKLATYSNVSSLMLYGTTMYGGKLRGR